QGREARTRPARRLAPARPARPSTDAGAHGPADHPRPEAVGMIRAAKASATDTASESVLSRLRRSNPIGYLFTLPYLIFFGVFVAYPVGFAIYLTVHNWNIVRPERPFVGLANFERLLFRDELFWRALYNTGVFLVVHIPLQIVVALALAVILNQQLVARGLFRVSFFL